MNSLHVYFGGLFAICAVASVVCTNNATSPYSDFDLSDVAKIKIYPEQNAVNPPSLKSFALICKAFPEENDFVVHLAWKHPNGKVIREKPSSTGDGVTAISKNILKLTFSRPQVRDSGKYTCSAVFSNNTRADSTIIVNFHDDIKFENCSEQQSLVFGTPGEIHCKLAGNYSREIFWSKDGVPITSERYTVSEGKLLVSYVTEDVQGLYTAEVLVLQTGQFKERTINVTIQYPTNETTCPPDRFRCLNNGNCIRDSYVCNGIDDCGDGSDEVNCRRITSSCSVQEFHCINGRCVRWEDVCDGHNDCGDWSDERNCRPPATTARSCFSWEWRCDNQLCINKNNICDGRNDCGDWSDERSCPSPRSTPRPCLNEQFHCSNGRCIIRNYVCDGDNDCGDWSDERNCPRPSTPRPCLNEQFHCSNGRCIPRNYVCDGDNDCGDWSDERNCPSTPRPGCSAGMFTCRNRRCIRPRYVCDGDNDCGDFSDESDCFQASPRSVSSFGAIIGVVSAFSVMMLVFILAVWCVKIRKQKNKAETSSSAGPKTVGQTPQQNPGMFHAPEVATQNGGSQDPAPGPVFHQASEPENVTQHYAAPYSSPQLHQPPTSREITNQHENLQSTISPDQPREPQPDIQQIPQSNLYPPLPEQAYPTAPENSA